MIIIDIININ